MPTERTLPARTSRAKRIDPDAEVDPDRNAEPPWEDEVEEVEAPAARRNGRSNGEKEVDVRPSSRAASRRETKPTPPRRSRAQQREDYEDETGNEEAKGGDTVLPRIRRGRDEINKARNSEGTIFFKWSDDGKEQVLKFLDVEPWSYSQHWVTRAGKQSFACIGDDCPLCKAGIKTSERVVYLVLNLSVPDPVVQGLEVGVSVYDDLEAYNEDKRHGPLPRLWWAASRSKLARPKGLQKWNYDFQPIKERDLEEEFDIPLDFAEDALAAAEPLTEDQYFGKLDVQALQQIANETYGG